MENGEKMKQKFSLTEVNYTQLTWHLSLISYTEKMQ